MNFIRDDFYQELKCDPHCALKLTRLLTSGRFC
jgi:hypothetical protein